MAGVVLVTGAGRAFGERVAARLSEESSIARTLAVDTVPPRGTLRGRTEFVRADVRSPLIATVLGQARVGTVLHTAVADRHLAGLESLLAACERTRTLTRLVVQSSTAVYGTRSAASVATEHAEVDDRAEAMVRAFARRRRDVTVTVLRFAELVGRGLDTPLMRGLAAPVVTAPAGFDPCLQLLHVDDAVDVAAQACVERHPGAFNVAGDGVATLGQLARRLGVVRVPVVVPFHAAGLARFGRQNRVVDTSLVASRFGFTPRYSTVEAFDAAFGDRRGLVPDLAAGLLGAAERWVRA